MRTGAILIGVIFGGLFLFFFIAESYADRGAGLANLRISDALLLIAGPISFVCATLLGLKFERPAGYWLVTGGLVTAVLLAIRLSERLGEFLVMGLIIVIPMLIEGGLWLKHAGSRAPH